MWTRALIVAAVLVVGCCPEDEDGRTDARLTVLEQKADWYREEIRELKERMERMERAESAAADAIDRGE